MVMTHTDHIYGPIRAYSHGGQCCGVSHIMGFCCLPDEDVCETSPTSVYNDSNVHYNQEATKGRHFFPLNKETCEDRLASIIAKLKEMRSSGCIEVILADRYGDKWQCEIWGPILTEKHGFVEVSSFFNSNTDNRCRIYHLYYGQDEYADTAPDDEWYERPQCCEDSCGAPGCCCDC